MICSNCLTLPTALLVIQLQDDGLVDDSVSDSTKLFDFARYDVTRLEPQLRLPKAADSWGCAVE